MSTRNRIHCLLLLVGFSLASPLLAADPAKDAKRLQQQLRAMEREKSQLMQAKTQLDGQLKVADEKAEEAKRSSEFANRKRAVLEKSLADAKEEIAALGGSLAELQATLAQKEEKLNETAGALQKLQGEHRGVVVELAGRRSALDACETKNGSLHRLGASLIKDYDEKGCFTSLLQQEPFTGLKRVEIEARLDEYREHLDRELVERQLEEQRKLTMRQVEAERRVQERLAAEQRERERTDAEQAKRQRAKQQNDLDRISRKLRNAFGDFEW